MIIFLIVLFWYYFDLCLLIVVEKYLLGKKFIENEKYSSIKFFNHNLILKHKKIYNFAVYCYLLLFIFFFIKCINLYKNKNIK
jgi:hypothetical protein